jgi:diamine N-acetyltransferase
MKKKILEGESIKLRAVEPGDVEFIYQMENDAETWVAGNTVVPFSRFQIEQYALSTQHNIYSEKQLRLMIELQDTDV